MQRSLGTIFEITLTAQIPAPTITIPEMVPDVDNFLPFTFVWRDMRRGLPNFVSVETKLA